jgi:hypothetical protein
MTIPKKTFFFQSNEEQFELKMQGFFPLKSFRNPFLLQQLKMRIREVLCPEYKGTKYSSVVLGVKLKDFFNEKI